MNDIGLAGVATIWLHLLLPAHWPLLLAGLATVVYRRRLRQRGKFFIVSAVLGYGVQGLANLPWPIVWMMFFDDSATAYPQILAIWYLYLQSLVALLITVWVVRALAIRYWQHLFP